MIQLPSKIRTTLFTIASSLVPLQVFSHEDDRLAAILYLTAVSSDSLLVGRTSNDVLNTSEIGQGGYVPITIYGSEPLWIGVGSKGLLNDTSTVVIHGIYRV